MTKREAKRFALWLSSLAIQASLDSGWPFKIDDLGQATWEEIVLEDADGDLTPDGKRLADAFDEVVGELHTRGWVRPSKEQKHE